MPSIFKAGVATTLAALCVHPAAVFAAGPSEYVKSPIIEEGEREIDVKAGTAGGRAGTRESADSLGFGWAPTRWYFGEIYAKWHKEPGDTHRFDAWEVENRFQLTETGRYPVDVGILLEIERPKQRDEGYELRWGVLLQSDLTNRIQGNLNILVEQHVRAEESSRAQAGYEWQLKYRQAPTFEWGAQGFGGVGAWNHWDHASEQTHQVGPAIFGRFALGERRAIKYNAGLLFGVTHASPRQTLRAQVEYEF